MILSELESIVLNREISFFEKDINQHHHAIFDKIQNSRILVIGAAGSIGGAFTRLVAEYHPRGLWLVDPSENNLAETVRDLRSSNITLTEDFGTVAIGFGTIEFEAFLSAKGNFDYVLNFAALKHVRSERDPFTLMRMLDVNIQANDHLLRTLERQSVTKVFAVSSDKAVLPQNLMGASKAFMERLFLQNADRYPFNSARFANVTFSDGSLLYSFLNRLRKKQPLTAPYDVRRYFISHREAAQLCLLSCFTGINREIYIPRMDPEQFLMSFSDIAETVLQHCGYEPIRCCSETEALNIASKLTNQSKEWPCYFSSSNTSGEKSHEEFVGPNEKVDESRFSNIRVVSGPATSHPDIIQSAITKIEKLKSTTNWNKNDIIEILEMVVPELVHEDLNMNLDQKM